ncbi:MAG: hypothetical protein ABSB56_08145 [Nitrososphaerales archaeon]
MLSSIYETGLKCIQVRRKGIAGTPGMVAALAVLVVGIATGILYQDNPTILSRGHEYRNHNDDIPNDHYYYLEIWSDDSHSDFDCEFRVDFYGYDIAGSSFLRWLVGKCVNHERNHIRNRLRVDFRLDECWELHGLTPQPRNVYCHHILLQSGDQVLHCRNTGSRRARVNLVSECELDLLKERPVFSLVLIV